jgi:chromate reductase
VQQLRQVLGFLNVELMNEPELYLANVAGVFGKDGTIPSDSVANYIAEFADAFAAWVREHAI